MKDHLVLDFLPSCLLDFLVRSLPHDMRLSMLQDMAAACWIPVLRLHFHCASDLGHLCLQSTGKLPALSARPHLFVEFDLHRLLLAILQRIVLLGQKQP